MNSEQLLNELGVYDLTPVEQRGRFLFKRDDLFASFGADSVNGGKLRQGAFLLAQAKEQGYKRIITGCSIHSPQAPIIAALAKHFGLSCRVIYGGTDWNHIKDLQMPKLVDYFGSSIQFAKSGRSNVLYAEAKKIQEKSDFIVQYGMCSEDPKNFVAFYESTANQVRNLPDKIDNLVVVCGSGITSAGILYGLQRYNKHVNHIWLIGNGPNRKKKIEERLSQLAFNTGIPCWNCNFNYIDLFGQGLKYETSIKANFSDIEFHENYEAKAFDWIIKNENKFKNQEIGFWIIGSKPKLLETENANRNL